MSNAITDLLKILDLEKIEENLFRGHSPQVGWQRVFGGLVIAQALVAAERTVEGDAVPHSLHAYFLLGGDPSVPIVYQVNRLRDGRSFATRRCEAIQHGKVIFSLGASFHRPEEGLEHAFKAPDAPPPEDLPDESAFVAKYGELMPDPVLRYFQRERPIEMRPVDPGRYISRGSQDDMTQKVWVRTSSRLPDDPAIHRATLAYLSDMTLLDTSLIAHGLSVFHPTIQPASLDHALWMHRPFRADEWMLYVQDSPSASSALGFARGALYSRSGVLIASVAQEGLIRVKRDPATKTAAD